MRQGQTIFPYVLVTESTAVSTKAQDFAVDGMQSGFGLFTFSSESQPDELFAALSEAGTDFALIRVYDKSVRGDGNFMRVFGHIK